VVDQGNGSQQALASRQNAQKWLNSAQKFGKSAQNCAK
jgi:hypothetical protein